jgi:epoxyqueuosine reductase
MNLEQEIKAKALELGFDAVGITDAGPVDSAHVERLHTWLDAGYAGQMQYMARNVAKRVDPTELLPGAQSVIVVALNYKPATTHSTDRPPVTDTHAQRDPSALSGAVAQYACYEDYHDFIRPLLHALAGFAHERTGQRSPFKVCVDSVPLAERALAMRAGLGFIGKNHMLIHPTLGPQVLLGELVTGVRLDPDPPSTGSCAGCDRCVRACPTGALRADGQFDANRCISYLTMEHRGTLDPELARRIGDRLFGCDECVLACPYRDAAPPCANQHFRFHSERRKLNLQHLLEMTPGLFETGFAGSPIHRIGLNGLQRNARICVDNLRRD